jgi:Domain of unknown function (DUF4331)
MTRLSQNTKLMLLGGVAALTLTAGEAFASSHREAPNITEDPSVDCTDVYAFVSPDRPDTITIVANYYPLEEPSGGPNYFAFSDSALYELHIDNDGDAVEDVTFQLEFSTETRNDMTFLYNTGPITAAGEYQGLNVVQRYTLTRVDGDRRTGQRTVLASDLLVAPNNVGPKSIADYASLAQVATYDLNDGSRVFCGPRDDPFFINLGRAFDLLNIDPVLPGGEDAQCGLAPDHLAGFNVHTIAIQIPIASLTVTGTRITDPTDSNAILGVWSTSSRRQVCLLRTDGRDEVVGGAWTQVSRLGMPLVNELVIPRRDKNRFNNSQPADDGQFLPYVQQPELAGILNALFNVGAPTDNRDDLVQTFLTGLPGLNEKGVPCEYLRLNTAIQPTPQGQRNRLGALAGQTDGFPNGRRLEDDVVDIALRVVAGALVDPTFSLELGDTVCENDLPFSSSFPYLATPHDGVNRQHR